VKRNFFLVLLLLTAQQSEAQTSVSEQVCIGSSKSYWVDSTGNPSATYSWAVSGTIVQHGTVCKLIHTWNTPGTFDLTLKKSLTEGCSYETSLLIPVYLPDGIRVFPNPIFGLDLFFQITWPASSPVTIELFSLNGQLIAKIFDGFLEAGILKTIPYRSSLQQGIYPYQIRLKEQVVTGRIIVIRTY
jgi:hypothetical protein